MNPILVSSHDVGLWAKLIDKRGKVLRLKDGVTKMCVERDRLWKELLVKAKVLKDG